MSSRHRMLALCLFAGACAQQEASGGSGGDSGSSASGGAHASGSGGQSSGSGGSQSPSGSGGAKAGSGGASGSGSGGSASGGAGSGGSASGGASSGGSGSGGSGVGSGGAASGGSGSGSGGAASGSGGTTSMVAQDHCLYGYAPQPTDDTMAYGPADFYPPGNMSAAIVDTTVQPEVLAWMHANYWEGAHVEWHAIRTCNLPGGAIGSNVNICQYTNLIPKDQNCQTGGDGYQFLLFHRHMLQSLKQLWPKHAADFDGFPAFPQSASDLPQEWQAAWMPFTGTDLAVGKMLDQIDKPENLAMFPDEGTLGFYLQCQAGIMMKGFSKQSDGIHFSLHAKWVRMGNTTHGVGNTQANVDNYMFWKLHGWIDNVWEKYRVAKGQSQSDQKYKDDMLAQCREMDMEETIVANHMGTNPPDPTQTPLPQESGFFHTMVRPILESATAKCSGCHSETGPEAGMSLGGHISSADVVKALVNVQARGGGQYVRIKPNDPANSWLYLKITGQTSTCTPTSTGQCSLGVMPPDASNNLAVTSDQADIIKQWIMMGAPAPTEVVGVYTPVRYTSVVPN